MSADTVLASGDTNAVPSGDLSVANAGPSNTAPSSNASSLLAVVEAWSGADVGPVGVAGSFSETGGVVTVNGGGTDIYGRTDQFYFAYTSLTGDGTITARVTSVENTNTFAKAGVMIRESLAANSRHAFIAVEPGAIEFERRTTTGGTTAYNQLAGVTAPYWVRLVRTGNTVTAHRSADGVTWTSMGSVSLAMGQTVQVGLAVTAHDNAQLNTSTFDNVSVVTPASTPPAAPTSLAASATGEETIRLTWGDASTNETGFEIERKSGAAGTFAYVDTAAANATSFTDTAAPPLTDYVYRVRAINAVDASAYSNEAVTQPLPPASTLADADIGTVRLAGSRTESGGTQTVRGSGADIYGAADQFHFSYQSFTGDGSITARVVSVQNTNAHAKAGVMIRESTAPNSRQALMAVKPSGLEFNRRLTTGGSTPYNQVTGLTAPYWVRLVRAGSTFSAFRSSDGVNWIATGTATIAMGQAVLAGLAVTSHNVDQLTTAVFDNLSIVTQTPTAPAAPTGLTAQATSPQSVRLAWTDAAVNETGFQIERQTGHHGEFLPIGTAAANAVAYVDDTVAAASEYGYRVRAVNSVGPSAYSNEFVLDTPAASAFAGLDIGPVGSAGSTTMSGDVYTVKGSGNDIFNTSDAFHFAYQAITGDGTITARVTTVQNTNPSAKAGVMIRASLAPNAAHATVAVEPTGVEFMRRGSAGGQSAYNKVNGLTAPYWVRVVRSGTTAQAFRSNDGVTWTSMGSATINFGATVYVGLAVTAHDNSMLNTSTFDNVSVQVTPPAAPGTFAWSSGAPMPLARYEGQSAVVGRQLFSFGGFYNTQIAATARVDAYDVDANAWTQMDDMPEAVTHAGQAVDGSLVYLAGGFVGNHPGPTTDHVWVYDADDDHWHAGPSLPAPRAGGGLAIAGRTLHYFGGAVRDPATQNSVDYGTHWTLDLGPTASHDDDGTTWLLAPAMPNPRNHIAGIGVGGKVYAIGGQYGGNEATGAQAELDVYDPTTRVWTKLADMPSPRSHIAATTFARRGRIVIVTGLGNGSTKLNEVIEYDPATNVWLTLPDYPLAAQSPVAGLIGDTIYASGGRAALIGAQTYFGQLAGAWSGAASSPVSMGEVAGGIIGKKMYLVGEGNAATIAYDLSTDTWQTSGMATRPFVGHHHSAEVVGGKLYLFGGLVNSSGGKVQIYDPVANTWSQGAPMPWAGGSVSTAVINGLVYVAGGIVGSTSTTRAAIYNPVANSWTDIPDMPASRNHAAGTTDGARFYVIGGRTGPNQVANGFDTVQVYNPASNTWGSSDLPASTLAPLPQARGGMGKAVYFNGEIYVMGGETATGAGATANGVYARVDIYNPVLNTWRLGSPMPTPRHGIFPLLYAGRIYVGLGGTQAGGSASNVLQILYLQ